jgi:hypothetical protein
MFFSFLTSLELYSLDFLSKIKFCDQQQFRNTEEVFYLLGVDSPAHVIQLYYKFLFLLLCENQI